MEWHTRALNATDLHHMTRNALMRTDNHSRLRCVGHLLPAVWRVRQHVGVVGHDAERGPRVKRRESPSRLPSNQPPCFIPR